MFWLIASEESADQSQVVHLERGPLASCRHLAGSLEEFQLAAVTRLLAGIIINIAISYYPHNCQARQQKEISQQ